jgi:hypothetical protein
MEILEFRKNYDKLSKTWIELSSEVNEEKSLRFRIQEDLVIA